MDHNPYAAPKVELIEARTPASLAGGRWSPGHLRLLAWLSLALLLAQSVLFGLSFLGGTGRGDALDSYSLWLGVLCTLLGCYLSWRATQFLVERFGARGMAWPLWLSIGLALVIQAYAVIFDAQLDGTPNAALAGFMALFLPSGLVGLWYGGFLKRLRQGLVDRQPAVHRLFAGLGEGALQQARLFVAQGPFQPGALGGEAEQALALVGRRGFAADQLHLLQLPKRHVQRLLAHAQGGQQLLHAQPALARDEEQDAVVHPAQAAAGEDLVRLGGERPVAEVKGLHGFRPGVGGQKVRHIDVSVRPS